MAGKKTTSVIPTTPLHRPEHSPTLTSTLTSPFALRLNGRYRIPLRRSDHQGRGIGNTTLDDESSIVNFTILVNDFANIYLVSFYLSNDDPSTCEGDDEDVVQVFASSITLGILDACTLLEAFFSQRSPARNFVDADPILRGRLVLAAPPCEETC